MDSLGGAGMSAYANTDPKTTVMKQIQQEAAMQNAKMLVEKLNEHCFEKCIPTPGSSLSKTEEKCFTMCMQKYMSAWNVVSTAYIAQIQKTTSNGAPGSGIF